MSIKEKPIFKILIAYQDAISGAAALRMYDRVAHLIGAEFEPSGNVWKFDALAKPSVQTKLLKEIEDANLIIFSHDHDFELPSGFRTWIHSWLPHKDESSALINLIGAGEKPFSGFSSAHSFFKDVTRNAKITFFSHFFKESSSPSEPDIFNEPVAVG